MKESNIPEVTTTEQEGAADSHTVEHEHNTQFELIRLAVMAMALVLSWFDVWKSIASFDIIALAITVIGGYPMYKEAFENIRERKMTMELSMTIAVVATLFIQQYLSLIHI